MGVLIEYHNAMVQAYNLGTLDIGGLADMLQSPSQFSVCCNGIALILSTLSRTLSLGHDIGICKSDN